MSAHRLKRLIHTIEVIGDIPSNTLEERQQHTFLIYMALLMSGGGLLWGGLCLYFKLYAPSVIPFGYVIITALNLIFFSLTKRFSIVRTTQVSLSLLLPVLFQLTLGGFTRSGAVMLWSLLALGGSLTFSDMRLGVRWLIFYVFCTLLCGLLDEPARLAYTTPIDHAASTMFFVINISVITSIFFILTLLMLNAHRRTQTDLMTANTQVGLLVETLEERVEERTRALKDALKQREEMAEQLATSERLSALGTLAAGIAHEINNPLTYVMSSLELMREDLNAHTSPDVTALLEQSGDALEGLERISKIIQELRGFMRSRSSARAPVDLAAAVRSALNICQHEVRRKATLDTDLPTALPLAYADERQIVQVIINLIVNAAQAFEREDTHRNKISVSVRHINDALLLEVRDNASGMPPEIARRVFDPFFTTKRAVGTGLGLSICHRMIHDLGGSISLETAVGVGTAFKVTLPLYVPSEHSSLVLTPTPLTHIDLKALHDIMVIDDEPDVGRLVARLLGTERVRAFTSPVEALASLDTQTPQVIICDLIMPELSGLDVYNALSARGLAERALIITGGATHEELKRSLDETRAPILYKPFKADELRERVWRVAMGAGLVAPQPSPEQPL
jgi:signal transduction histidine kinase